MNRPKLHASNSPASVSNVPAQRMETQLSRIKHLRQRGQFVAAGELAERFLQEEPNCLPALVEFSQIFSRLFLRQQAIDCLRRAEGLAEEDPRSISLVGRTWLRLRQREQAKRLLQPVIERLPRQDSSRLALAQIYLQEGRCDEAASLTVDYLKARPEDAEANLLLAEIQWTLGRTGDCQKRSQAIFQAIALPISLRAQAACLLSRTLESQDDFVSSWDVMVAGKRMVAERASEYSQRGNEIREALVRCRPGLLQQLSQRSPAAGTAANILVTGVPRSGTTILAKWLSTLPATRVADEYELFAALIWPGILGGKRPADWEIGQLSDRRKQAMGGTYCRLRELNETPVDCYVDKNPSLSMFGPLYLSVVPNSRLLYVRRDARDVLISCFQTYMPPNMFSCDFKSPERAFERIHYEQSLESGLDELFDSGLVQHVNYESFVQSGESVFQQLTSSLGVRTEERVPATLQVHSPNHRAVRRQLHCDSTERWKRFENQLRKLPGFSSL